MRRMVLMIATVIMLVACASQENTKNNAKEKEQGVEVEKGLIHVEITLPETFFEGEEIDEVIENAKADGVAEVIKNPDGSLTYKMSKAKHKELLKEMKESILDYVDELINEDDYPSIQNVTYEKGFQEFTMHVDKDIFENSLDGFATLGLGITGMYYQVFDEGNFEENKVTIHLQDASTGEIFDSIIYPDALDE